MTDDDIAFASIDEVGGGYRAGRFSPVEVTKLCLGRIARLDGALNAFITVLGDAALEAAERAARELADGHDRGPLHGIPVAIKDLIDMAGVPTTFASRAEPGYVGKQDAALVTSLRRSGAVIIGKTNLLEFAYGLVHPDFGQTNNPWDITRTSGGSSGGSAAAVAAGMCYAAVGTDTGGSIRIPAAYCGIAGLKPTWGLVDTEGVYPLSWSLDHAGPLARTSADAAAFLGGLAGRPFAAGAERITGLRLGVLAQHRDHAMVSADIREGFGAACRRLAEAGATLVDVSISDFDLVEGALMTVMLPEASVPHAERVRRRPEGYAGGTREQIDLGFAIPATAYVRAQQFRRLMGERVLRAFEGLDALVSPTVPWPAPAEDPPIDADGSSGEMLCIAIHNLVGIPALSLPCGLSPEGMPIGFQIATPPHADARALAIGTAFEEVLPPPLSTDRRPDWLSGGNSPETG